MRYEVELPELVDDDSVESTISSWYVEDGEMIEEGEDLVEVTTSKDVYNIPSPVSGKLIETISQEGDVVRVGDTIAIIETSSEEW